MTVNLRHQEGREVLAKLIAGSDVLVDNFQSGSSPASVSTKRGFSR
jgi:crotonobetainyl-CoA:carnitine CoA-transferase CaiB-like acyl-CoA transferase